MGHPVIIGIFVAYFAIVIGLGYLATKTQKNMTDFIVAGRQMGPVLVAFSTCARLLIKAHLLRHDSGCLLAYGKYATQRNPRRFLQLNLFEQSAWVFERGCHRGRISGLPGRRV